MALVRTLIDRDRDHFEPALPPGLRQLYDGDLHFRTSLADRPFVIANFVATLDGVTSYEIKGKAPGSTISGGDPADRFVMGLLRASADAIVAGSPTVHVVSPESLWIPEYTYPDAKLLYMQYRVNIRHKPEYPLLAVARSHPTGKAGRRVCHARPAWLGPANFAAFVFVAVDETRQ